MIEATSDERSDHMESPTLSISADKCYDTDGRPRFSIKIQQEPFEINITVRKEEIRLFGKVRNACWDNRGSIRFGECADAPVFWCSTSTDISILVGHDDETWDIAVTIPLSAIDDIEAALQTVTNRGR
jgi:hypothetical protein